MSCDLVMVVRFSKLNSFLDGLIVKVVDFFRGEVETKPGSLAVDVPEDVARVETALQQVARVTA